MSKQKWYEIKGSRREECDPPWRAAGFTAVDLMARVDEANRLFDEAISEAARRWLDEHPEAVAFDPSALRCDVCGRKADTVHWYPWATRPAWCSLACPRHDTDGYWMRIAKMNTGPADFRKPDRVYSSLHHLIDTKSVEAVTLWLERLDEARRGEGRRAA